MGNALRNAPFFDPSMICNFPGVFQPPVNGVYLLTFYGIVTRPEGGNIFIKQNDDILCKCWLNNADYTSTCTAVEELTTGDSVRVTGDNNESSALRGNSY